MEEAGRRGGLVLAEARAVLRIDVNKTRRIFDLLVAQGVLATRQ